MGLQRPNAIEIEVDGCYYIEIQVDVVGTNCFERSRLPGVGIQLKTPAIPDMAHRTA